MATETLDNVNSRSDAPLEPVTSTARGPARFFEFLGEVRAELKRVTWPSQAEVYATTVVVILTSLVFGLYLFGIDLLLNTAVRSLFQRFGGA